MRRSITRFPEGDFMNDERRVLVTGASGFVGSRLVKELIARGKRIRLLLRKSPELFHGIRSYLLVLML